MQTSRLNLRSWRADDLESLFEICSDKDVMKFVGAGTLWTRTRCQEFIEQNKKRVKTILITVLTYVGIKMAVSFLE